MKKLLVHKNSIFYFRCPFEERHLAKDAGFKFDKEKGVWFTDEIARAQNLKEFANEECFWMIHRFEEKDLKSRATDSKINILAPLGLKFREFQKAGIEYLIDKKFSFIADEQGCISGDAKIIINRAGCSRQFTMRELYEKSKKRFKLRPDVVSKCRSLKKENIGLNNIKEVIFSGIKEVIRITLENGNNLDLTPDHEVMTDDGFFPAKDLFNKNIATDTSKATKKTLKNKKLRDNLGQGKVVFSKCISIESIGYIDTYDIKCEGPHHNFVVNNILVHNCGKTIQAIGLMNHLRMTSGIIICPVTLLDNWVKEFKKWKTGHHKIAIIRTLKDLPLCEGHHFLVLSYGLFQSNALFIQLQIALGTRRFDVLFWDEAHYTKTITATRTMNILGDFAMRFDRHYPMSGTPLEGRPVDLFPILKRFAWATIDHMSYWAFAKYYNGAYESDFGWVLGRGKNLDILNAKLRQNCFLRREKKDVLPELPPKVFTYIDLDTTKMIEDLIAIEGSEEQPTHVATVRKQLGLLKVEPATEYISNLIEGGLQKVVVFGWHSEAIDALAKKLKKYNPVCIKGDTPAEKRQGIVDLFQKDPEIQVFIGNIKAAGVGLTLTAAHTEVFFELSWNEMQNRQAMDRVHRIGQMNSVNIHFLTFPATMDDRVIKSCKAKWEDFSEVTA